MYIGVPGSGFAALSRPFGVSALGYIALSSPSGGWRLTSTSTLISRLSVEVSVNLIALLTRFVLEEGPLALELRIEQQTCVHNLGIPSLVRLYSADAEVGQRLPEVHREVDLLPTAAVSTERRMWGEKDLHLRLISKDRHDPLSLADELKVRGLNAE